MDEMSPMSNKALGKRKVSEQDVAVLEVGTSNSKKYRSEEKEGKSQKREIWPEYFQDVRLTF